MLWFIPLGAYSTLFHFQPSLGFWLSPLGAIRGRGLIVKSEVYHVGLFGGLNRGWGLNRGFTVLWKQTFLGLNPHLPPVVSSPPTSLSVTTFYTPRPSLGTPLGFFLNPIHQLLVKIILLGKQKKLPISELISFYFSWTKFISP